MANAYIDSNGVFKNLLGQTDAQALQVAEYGFTTARSIEILGGHVQLEVSGFGLQRLAAIHKHLFQDVYEWAGKNRTVPSSKRAGVCFLVGSWQGVSWPWIERSAWRGAQSRKWQGLACVS